MCLLATTDMQKLDRNKVFKQYYTYFFFGYVHCSHKSCERTATGQKQKSTARHSQKHKLILSHQFCVGKLAI